MPKSRADVRLVLSPGLQHAPVLDRMCSQFVLTLTMRHAARFNLRRDWNSLLSLTGQHLVWPATVLARLREFLQSRCKGNEQWTRPRRAERRRLHAAPRRTGAARTRKARCSSTSTSTSRTRRRTCSPCSAPPPSGWHAA